MYARRAFAVPPERQNRKGAMELSSFWFLILVQNHAVNQHVVAFSDVVDADRNTHFNSRSYRIFIESLAASRHISDCLTEAVSPRSASFFEHDCTARSVLRDRAATFSRVRRRGSLRDLRPFKRGHNCQGHTKQYFF